MARKNDNRVSRPRMIRSLVTVVLAAVLMGLSAGVMMKALNSKMGVEPGEVARAMELDTLFEFHEYSVPEMPGLETEGMGESAASVWVPDWKVTPCSLFISSDGTFLLDSLPEARDSHDRATELQLLMELWAGHYGFTSGEVERVWAFARNDSCFIDLPSQADWGAVVLTVESRFISFTMLFPFVAGELVSGYDSGIPVRGIAGNR